MEIAFKINPERMTLGDRIALEESSQGMTSRQQRDVLARHMVNEAGEFMEFEDACKVLNSVTMARLNDIVAQFSEAIQALSGALVPPTSGGR